MKKTKNWILIQTLALSVSLGFSVAHAREVGMYGTTDWTSTCSANDLSTWDNMAQDWYDTITSHSGYSKDGKWVDGSINNKVTCDPDSGSGCRDYNYMDEKDAVILFGHGADDGDHWSMIWRNEGPDGSCWVEHPGASDQNYAMYAGDVDLEFLHLSSCNSMDDDNLPNAWRAMRDPADSGGNGRRLHQMNGFHGCMWIGSGYISDYGDFADDGFSSSISDAWLYNHYYEDSIDWTKQLSQCPVSYAIGSSASDCLDRLNNERYNNVYSDPGTITHYCYAYFAGCDPACESAFNPGS